MIKIIIGLNLITTLLSNNVGIATNKNQIEFINGTGYYSEQTIFNENQIYFIVD